MIPLMVVGSRQKDLYPFFHGWKIDQRHVKSQQNTDIRQKHRKSGYHQSPENTKQKTLVGHCRQIIL